MRAKFTEKFHVEHSQVSWRVHISTGEIWQNLKVYTMFFIRTAAEYQFPFGKFFTPTQAEGQRDGGKDHTSDQFLTF